jgi:hypothetical protein
VSKENNTEAAQRRIVDALLLHGSIDKAYRAVRQFGISRKDVREEAKRQDGLNSIAGGAVEAPDAQRPQAAGRRFVFTVAQNNTRLHEGFWQSLLRFVEDRDATLMVGKTRYNKSGFQNLVSADDEENTDVWFDPRLEPYFATESVQVTPSLVWCGELDILPTAEKPFSGMMTYTRSASSIFPHVKVQMASGPTMKFQPPRFLYTTGAVTLRNYIQRKAGQKAAFHHVFGALYVEIDDDGEWFARQIIADRNGTFYEMTDHYMPDGIERGCRVVGINWGDLHAEKEAPEFVTASNAMLDDLKPEFQFANDLSDFDPRNHHNIKDPYFMAEQFWNGLDSVEAGIKMAHAQLQRLYRPWCKTVVVESNHDQALQKWLANPVGHMDGRNAYYWHRLNTYIHECIRENKDHFVFEHALRSQGSLPNAEFLREDDSFLIAIDDTGQGIECGLHGHRGPNGARGSSAALRNVGVRINKGHDHTASIIDGVYSAGVSATLDMKYNKGPSSWSWSHIITYQNGKRAIVTQRGIKYRA